ncbi:MAG: SDR family oxidoreductase [Bacteroidota bacterium]
MNKLQSKTIIITGGSLGIGLEIAKKCAEEGARIIIAARNENDLMNAVEELKKISQNDHVYYVIDVSDLKSVKDFANWCEKERLEINGLVNCAGIYGPIGKTTEIDLEEFRRAVSINFFGTVYMCSTFAPLIKPKTKKKIVNYSGGGAASPFANYSAYATSKIAIVRFTENFAIELQEENFDVNCVAPGFVATRLHNETLEAGESRVGNSFFENTKQQLEKGGVSPVIAANLTVFLLSEESDGITGKFISAPWDQWSNKEFQDLLKSEKDFATLRRIDNKTFFKKI